MESPISVNLAKAKYLRWRMWDYFLVLVSAVLIGAYLDTRGDPGSLDFMEILPWILVTGAVLTYHWFARNSILSVSQTAISLRALTGAFEFPASAVRRLAFYQPIRRRGLSGIYTIETRDGAVGRVVVEPRDRSNPAVAEALLRIESVTGLAWIGREAEARRGSGLRVFLASLRRGSQMRTTLEFAGWCVRSALSVRGELAGIGGPAFRWGMSFFGLALACLLVLAFIDTIDLSVREGASGFRAGWSAAGDAKKRAGGTGSVKPSENLKATGAEFARRSAELRKEELQSRMDDVKLLAAVVVWCSTCFGVNVLLTLMGDQRRSKEALEAELGAARNVQSRLLPTKTPQIASFEIAGACLPAFEVGGDYYDYVPLADGRLVIPIADVSGKGLGAGLLMTLTKGYLTSSLEQGSDLLQSLRFVNRKILESSKESAFVSMVLAQLNPASESVSIARAGHNFPLVVRGGCEPSWISTPGLALGMQGPRVFDRTCGTEEVRLDQGDVLVLYTDGLTEAMNPHREEYGEDRLAAEVVEKRGSPAGEIRDAILSSVLGFRAGAAANDDLTLVVVRRV